MGRVEAVIFASAKPVSRENLARVVGKACNLELIIDDIRDELRGRPYELVSVAGGWSFRTKLGFGDAIRAALGGAAKDANCRSSNAVVLMAIAYFQPITRGELSQFLGREVSQRRDRGAARRGAHRRRAAQPDARRALRLCHDAGVPGAIRVREPARPAGHREARGRGAARPDERGPARWRGAGVRAEGSARAEERRGSTRGGCSVMDDGCLWLDDRPSWAFNLRFPNPRSKTTATLPMQGSLVRIPLCPTRKSAETAVVYPVSRSCDLSRPTASPFSTFESFR